LQATVYRCLPGGRIETVHVFQDAENGEDFYTCAWSVDTATGCPMLLVAGKNAMLQVVNVATGWLETVSFGSLGRGRRGAANAPAAACRESCSAPAFGLPPLRPLIQPPRSGCLHFGH
jgi:hypothetical protein